MGTIHVASSTDRQTEQKKPVASRLIWFAGFFKHTLPAKRVSGEPECEYEKKPDCC